MTKEDFENFMSKYTKLIDKELSAHEERKAEMDKAREEEKEGRSFFQPKVKIELRLTPTQLIVISKILLEFENDEA